MKRIFLLTLANLISMGVIAQRYSERSYDIAGLSEGQKVVDALIKGVPCLIIGFLLAYFFTWQYADKGTGKTEGSQSIGCLGMIIMGIGVLLLLPLLMWIEAIAVSIVGVVIIIAVLYLIYHAITKKS